ncbi:tetraacyldisaccharide 4'-kinase [Roseateles sp. DAIF2]|uniref:tetraacyldisaccharide 4'-kinase n=1 Tax=Roseateles sp. DAIF2 TaxID=2714952 RepID=UPI0018A316BA|nr:tetraacyldisaccharide 4'-kinase [Roseateles sp. DAIF2]QPF73278.1 tetraacyldisaccharide 4'-kinase [Roseateles sp. DAIF2]
MSAAERLQRAWREGGPLAQALRPLGGLYGVLSALRAALYRWGWLKTEALPVPVVVVGNWIVGGAGKTPTTLALLRLLQARGIRAGVISRGYGRKDDGIRLVTRDSNAREVGDEPLLIHLRSGASVAVGRDRVAAARALLAAHPGLQLLISDDGLQHWRLPRQLSVLVFDERGLGNGRLLPAGPLRQRRPLSAEPALVLYNATMPSTPLAGHLARRELAGAVELAAWWRGEPADPAALRALQGRPVLAAAGMAQPERFFGMLRAQGLQVQGLALPDHFDFAALPWPADTPELLITEKDAVKLDPARLGSTRAWVVALDFRPDESFERAWQRELDALLS